MLIVAHRILIGAAILFGVFFTLWEALAYQRTGEAENAVVSVIAAVITLALAYYLKNLKRFLGGGWSPPPH